MAISLAINIIKKLGYFDEQLVTARVQSLIQSPGRDLIHVFTERLDGTQGLSRQPPRPEGNHRERCG